MSDRLSVESEVSTAALVNADAVNGIDHAIDEMYSDWRGLNYSPGVDVKTVAALVRRHVNDAIKSGVLAPVTKASVRIERFSMGCAVRVTLTVPSRYCTESTPGAVLMDDGSYNHNKVWAIPNGTGVAHYADLLAPGVHDATTRVERFVESFNRVSRDNGHGDYYNSSFYSSVTVREETAA